MVVIWEVTSGVNMTNVCSLSYSILHSSLVLGLPSLLWCHSSPWLYCIHAAPLRRKADHICVVRDGFPCFNRAAACNVTLAQVLITAVGRLGVRLICKSGATFLASLRINASSD